MQCHQRHGHPSEVLQIPKPALQNREKEKPFKGALHALISTPAPQLPAKPQRREHCEPYRRTVHAYHRSDEVIEPRSRLVACMRAGACHDSASNDGRQREHDDDPRGRQKRATLKRAHRASGPQRPSQRQFALTVGRHRVN